MSLTALAGLLSFPAGAQSITAVEILHKLRSAYASLKAVRVAAEREETSYIDGRPFSITSECELMSAPGGRYFARFKLADEEATVVSDGSNIWRALVSKKQWTKLSGASLQTSGGEDETANNSGRDLHGVLEGLLLYRFQYLAEKAQDPVLVKEEEYKLGHTKLQGYLVRAHTNESDFEILVDRQTFLALSAKEQRKSSQGTMQVVTRMKQLEINPEVDEALFSFTPKRGWKEVEMLVLPGEKRLLLTGEHAANFALKTLDGEAVSLAGLQGKVVVLDFWATWCGPCREELPLIEKLRTEFGDSVHFYGVNDEETSTVKRFVKENKLQMPVLLDSEHKVHARYGVHAIPTLLIIDPSGVIRGHLIGSRGEPALRKAIQSVLSNKA